MNLSHAFYPCFNRPRLITARLSSASSLSFVKVESVHKTISASTDELLDEFKMLASLGLLSTLEDVLQPGARNIQKDVLRAIRSSLSVNSKRGSFAWDVFDLS